MSNFVAYVKAHTIKHGLREGTAGQLGACPYSLRILLVLEEKNIPYEIDYINMSEKPEWLTKVNPKGQVPILKDKAANAYIIDSDSIGDYLEEKVQEPSMGKIENLTHPGEALWSHFTEFLKSQDYDQELKGKKQLKDDLRQIEGNLGDCGEPYFGGKNPNAWDCALAPRLYMARVGCKELKKWDFADEFTNLKMYLHRWMGRPSWRNCASFTADSIVEELRTEMVSPPVQTSEK